MKKCEGKRMTGVIAVGQMTAMSISISVVKVKLG